MCCSLVEYAINVFTGKKPRSGSTANVFVTFYGKSGPSPKLKLHNKKEEDEFQKGKQDVVHHIIDDKGPIVKLRLVHRICNAKSPISLFSMFVYTLQRHFASPEY